MAQKDRLSMAPRADRLRRIGELFLKLDPQAEAKGIAQGVVSFFTTEDMLLPVTLSPDFAEEAARVEAENRRLEQLPTSVEHRERWSFLKGQIPGEVQMVYYKHRADLGYKIPTVDVRGLTSEDERRLTIAETISVWIDQRRQRSPEERLEDETREAWDKTLYFQEQITLVLSPALLAQRQLPVVQEDLITGLSVRETADLTKLSIDDENTGGLVFRSEFNLLSQLVQKRHELPQDDPRAIAIQELFDEYLAK